MLVMNLNGQSIYVNAVNLKRDLSQKAFAAETYLHLAVKLSSV